MKQISLEELKQLNMEERIIIDIRTSEAYERGSIDGAINIPMKEISEKIKDLDHEKKICIFAHTDYQSSLFVKYFEEEGLDTYIIKGGYPEFLSDKLETFVQDEEAVKQRTKDIERSIIKKFRKSIWCKFTKGIRQYDMIQDGDKIAVCISGGKDSMLLAKLFQELKRHGRNNFELVFLVMNPGYNEANFKIIQNNAKMMGIPLTVFESDIFDVVVDIAKSPCYLCARMRRGFLYDHAKKLGCNKIALGHHFDDIIETTLMGMLYSGKIETMMPKLHSSNFEGMELIRPMCLVKEEFIKQWRDYNDLYFIQCACRFTEMCATEEEEHNSKREEMKQLIAQFRQTSDVIEKNIFKSVHNVNLAKIIGYHKGDYAYNFLDDYFEEEKNDMPPGMHEITDDKVRFST